MLLTEVKKLKLNSHNIRSFLVSSNKKLKKLRIDEKNFFKKLEVERKRKLEEKKLEKPIETGSLQKMKKGLIGKSMSLFDKIKQFFGLVVIASLIKTLPQILRKIQEFFDDNPWILKSIKFVWNVFSSAVMGMVSIMEFFAGTGGTKEKLEKERTETTRQLSLLGITLDEISDLQDEVENNDQDVEEDDEDDIIDPINRSVFETLSMPQRDRILNAEIGTNVEGVNVTEQIKFEIRQFNLEEDDNTDTSSVSTSQDTLTNDDSLTSLKLNPISFKTPSIDNKFALPASFLIASTGLGGLSLPMFPGNMVHASPISPTSSASNTSSTFTTENDASPSGEGVSVFEKFYNNVIAENKIFNSFLSLLPSGQKDELGSPPAEKPWEGGSIVQYLHGDPNRKGYDPSGGHGTNFEGSRGWQKGHDHFSFNNRAAALKAANALYHAGIKVTDLEGWEDGKISSTAFVDPRDHSSSGGHYGPVGKEPTYNDASDGVAFDVPWYQFGGSGPLSEVEYSGSRRVFGIVKEAIKPSNTNNKKNEVSHIRFNVPKVQRTASLSTETKDDVREEILVFNRTKFIPFVISS